MTTSQDGTLGSGARTAPRSGVDGIETIPDHERTGRPSDFAWIWPAAQFSLGTVVLGALPISFGLGWWSAVTSIVVGVAVGTAVLAPLVRVGLRTGMNDPMSSGAHFGLRGRAISNLITVVVALGFFAITVWVGGTAVMVAGERLLGTPTGSGALTAAMALAALVVALVAVRGHDALVNTYKVTAILGGAVLAALVLVLAPGFDPGYAGGEYALGDHTRTWLLAATASSAVPMSYATFQGDYSRYMSARGDLRAVVWTGGGMFLSCLVALLVGAYVTTFFPDPVTPWLQGLTDAVPGWFAAVVILFGFVGTLPQGALCLYAAGLSANAVFWRVPRTRVTAVVAVAAATLLYLGAVVYDAMDSMAAFVTLVLTVVAPWAAVMLVGFAAHRGRYAVHELRSGNGAGDSRYWYRNGVNPRAVAAFAVGSVCGILWVNNSMYVGPLAVMTGGVDLSVPVAFAVAAALYAALCRRWPETYSGPPIG
ncbi:cytosine permease [Thermobifida halotolerans]|uniref:Cytosine permease n=1 Tax=Thermobifida halotolerans TaxID=483545 RepID=A0AA97M2W6_9ACTN|nr:cytosine permease [Thermobifida halotolerans]UOE18563.1 cytosine permease [Thermobifida halotolerans]